MPRVFRNYHQCCDCINSCDSSSNLYILLFRTNFSKVTFEQKVCTQSSINFMEPFSQKVNTVRGGFVTPCLFVLFQIKTSQLNLPCVQTWMINYEFTNCLSGTKCVTLSICHVGACESFLIFIENLASFGKIIWQ